jgi:hypothetical protein
MSVTFVAKGSNRYVLQVKPEQKVPNAFGTVETIIAEQIHFDGGVYVAKDQRIIDAIRKCAAFREGRVFEMPKGQPRQRPAPTPVIRGALDTKSIHKEAGVEEAQDKKMALQEKGITKCPECPKQFTEDYQGFKLRGHMISHRRRK